MEDEEQAVQQTWQEKLLFYTTAFFVLLGTFSLFAFLFLVPFVIDPAFTTIFMEFDEDPAYCVTVKTIHRLGASNCSWTSCREGCTKDIYQCTQIFVDYKLNITMNYTFPSISTEEGSRRRRSLFEYEDYDEEDEDSEPKSGLQGNYSEWYFKGAKLFPNVKGCGYPPMLNCSIFLKTYKEVGTNFSCYYSKIDPGLVISHLDMWQVYMNLVYAMAIPIPSFIISVIYLTIAYFKIYNEDEEQEPLEKNAEAIDAIEGESMSGHTPIPPASGGLTPASEAFREDLASFGHHFKVAMVDDISRDSLVDGVVSSVSIGGNIGKTMTTSISTTGGPVADI